MIFMRKFWFISSLILQGVSSVFLNTIRITILRGWLRCFLRFYAKNNLVQSINKRLIFPHLFFFFFLCLGFLSRTFTNHKTAGEGAGISLTPHYHCHPLHRHLDISRAITAESSPLHIASSRNWTGNLWFPSESR